MGIQSARKWWAINVETSVIELVEWFEDVSAGKTGSRLITLVSDDACDRLGTLRGFYSALASNPQFRPAWAPALVRGSLIPDFQSAGFAPPANFTWLAICATDEPEAEAVQLLEQLEGLGHVSSTPAWVQACRSEIFQSALGPALVQNAGDAVDHAFSVLGDSDRPLATRVGAATRELHGLVSHERLLADGGALGRSGPGPQARALIAAGWLQRLAHDAPVVLVVDEAHKAGPFLISLVDLALNADAPILVVLSGESDDSARSRAHVDRPAANGKPTRQLGGAFDTVDGHAVEIQSLPSGRSGATLALLATALTSGLFTAAHFRRAVSATDTADPESMLAELLDGDWIRRVGNDVFAFMNDGRRTAAQQHAHETMTDDALDLGSGRICLPRPDVGEERELSALIEHRAAAGHSRDPDQLWRFANLLARYGAIERAASVVADTVRTPLERATVSSWTNDDSLERLAPSDDAAALILEGALLAGRYPADAKSRLARALQLPSMAEQNDETSSSRVAAARVFLAMGDTAGVDIALDGRAAELLPADISARLISLSQWRSMPGVVSRSVDAMASLTTIDTLRAVVPGSAALALALVGRLELLERLGRLDTAADSLAIAREARHILSNSTQRRPETTWRAVQWLSWAYQRRGDMATALVLLNQLLVEQTALFPEEHPAVLTTLLWRARCMLESGDLIAAHQEIDLVLNERTRTLSDHDPLLIDAHHWHAEALARERNYAAAAEELADVVANRAQTLAADDEDLLTSRHRFGSALANAGRHGDALRQFSEVIARRAAADLDDAPRLLAARHSRGVCLLVMGRHDEALRELDQVVEHRRVALETTDPLLLDSMADRATALVAVSRHEDALTDLDELLLQWAKDQPADHPRVIQGRQHRVICYVNLGRPNDAVAEIDAIIQATGDSSWSADDPILTELRAVRTQLQSARSIDRLDSPSIWPQTGVRHEQR